TILVTALPTLSAKLGATTDQLQWITTAYMLALAGFLIPGGVLADRLGRRRMLLLALAVFGVSSVAASQVTTANALILMRALMGISGAVVFPVFLAILPTIFSERERPRAVAIGGAGMFLGLPLGPLVAGWLLTHYEWGSIFLINGPVVMLSLLGVWLYVPESRDANAPRLDVVGAALVVTGVTSLVYGIIEQPALGWTDSTVVAGLLTGGILLTGFTVWELRIRSPLVDLRLFLNPRFSWSTLASVVMSFALMGVLFVLTPFLQIVQGNDAQATGARLLPLIGGIVLGAVGSDRLAARLGVRVMLPLGLLICAAGMGMLSMIQADSGYGLLAVALPVIGVGNAFAMFTAINVILDVLPASQTGAGTALTRTLQQLGSSFGVAIMGSLLNNAYRAELAGHLTGLPARLKDVAEGSVAGATIVAGHLPAQLGAALLFSAHDAYSVGMADVLRVGAGVMVAAALLLGTFMPARTRAAREQPSTRESAQPEVA
ncbi:MAG TPA: DHA2 family efflux MFS transporter permease subunit, partial [Candidatus Acidoferrales bacterium]|nr:DHA2 family efflux MFS transporter permease subunit [Candidatus Acidoferrales bacterium]